ncbi:MAG: hypothetical protein J1E42_05690 [Akkermansiaceae bacterium]|nr:hypothetical protein [Akkermansiaceae bacterium]
MLRFHLSLLSAFALSCSACSSPVEVEVVGVLEFSTPQPDDARMVLMLQPRALDPAQSVTDSEPCGTLTLQAADGQLRQAPVANVETTFGYTDLRFRDFPLGVIFSERPAAERLVVQGKLRVTLRDEYIPEAPQEVSLTQTSLLRVGRSSVRVSFTPDEGKESTEKHRPRDKAKAPAAKYRMQLETEAELTPYLHAEEEGVEIQHIGTTFPQHAPRRYTYSVTLSRPMDRLHLLLFRPGKTHKQEVPVHAEFTPPLPLHEGQALVPVPGEGISNVTVTSCFEKPPVKKSRYHLKPWGVQVDIPLSSSAGHLVNIEDTRPLQIHMADGSSATAQTTSRGRVYRNSSYKENALYDTPHSVRMEYGLTERPTGRPLYAEGEICLTLAQPAAPEEPQEISLTQPTVCYVGGKRVEFTPKREPKGTPPRRILLGSFDPNIPVYTLTIRSEIELGTIILRHGRQVIYADGDQDPCPTGTPKQVVYTLLLQTGAQKLSATLGGYSAPYTRRIPLRIDFTPAAAPQPAGR